jgi:hypothetical protein
VSLRSELQALYERNGRLTKSEVVEEARSHPESALNRHIFHVNQSEAAERYYLQRAGELIRTITVKRDPKGNQGEPFRLRAYHSVPDDELTRAYRSLDDVAEDEFASKLLLQTAEREWRQLRVKYGHLEAFLALVRNDVNAA